MRRTRIPRGLLGTGKLIRRKRKPRRVPAPLLRVGRAQPVRPRPRWSGVLRRPTMTPERRPSGVPLLRQLTNDSITMILAHFPVSYTKNIRDLFVRFRNLPEFTEVRVAPHVEFDLIKYPDLDLSLVSPWYIRRLVQVTVDLRVKRATTRDGGNLPPDQPSVSQIPGILMPLPKWDTFLSPIDPEARQGRPRPLRLETLRIFSGIDDQNAAHSSLDFPANISLPHLEVLQLSNMININDRFLMNVANIRVLRVLNSPQISGLEQGMQGFVFQFLRTLDLELCPSLVTEFLLACPSLETLRISRCRQFSGAIVAAPAVAAAVLPVLKTVSLETLPNLTSLDFLVQSTNLRQASLEACNRITDDQLFPVLSRVETLTISSMAGVYAGLRLAFEPPTLQQLVARSEFARTTVQGMPYLPFLKSLSVYRSPISGAILRHTPILEELEVISTSDFWRDTARASVFGQRNILRNLWKLRFSHAGPIEASVERFQIPSLLTIAPNLVKLEITNVWLERDILQWPLLTFLRALIMQSISPLTPNPSQKFDRWFWEPLFGMIYGITPNLSEISLAALSYNEYGKNIDRIVLGLWGSRLTYYHNAMTRVMKGKPKPDIDLALTPIEEEKEERLKEDREGPPPLKKAKTYEDDTFIDL